MVGRAGTLSGFLELSRTAARGYTTDGDQPKRALSQMIKEDFIYIFCFYYNFSSNVNFFKDSSLNILKSSVSLVILVLIPVVLSNNSATF